MLGSAIAKSRILATKPRSSCARTPYYLGTGTSKAYGFTSVNAARSTGDTVVLDYKTGGECDACAPAAVTSVRYQWRGDHVEMLDPAPPL